MEHARIEEIDYWLFSNSDSPRFARCRNEVPIELVHDTTPEEAEWICAKIREKLANKEFHEIYVKILIFFNDKTSLPILRELHGYYIKKHRVAKQIGGGFTPWICLLKDAIKHLTYN